MNKIEKGGKNSCQIKRMMKIIVYNSPDPITEAQTPSLGGQIFYTRTADVTTLVKNTGGGTYKAGGVPSTMEASVAGTSCCGWTLMVAYENLNYNFYNLTIYRM
ncbi:MAG: hypothetical protein ACRDAU_05420 [Clostridium sp.]